MEQARAYELGSHGPRDYHAAAEIYRTSCNGGEGDIEACGVLIRAALHSRGTDLDKATVMELASKICVARRDPFACVIADVLSPSEAVLPPEVMAAVKEALATPPPCDATHVNGCWAAIVAGSFGRSDGSSAEARREEQEQHVCSLGIIEGCIELVRYARDRDAQADARHRVAAACDTGDADACEAIERRIDPKTLCAANDYDACGLLGCAGDEAAAELADAHGADVRCDRQTVPAPVTTAITPAPRPPFDSIEFHPLGALRRDRGPRYEIYNASTRTVVMVFGSIYAYDDAGNQLARNTFELRHVSLAPGAGTTLVVGGRGGDSLEACVDLIQFADESDPHVARCPGRKAKGARWGDGRDTVQLRVNLSGIPLADDWAGTLEPMLAEPFEQSHLGIRILAISGDYAAVFLAPGTFTAAELATFTAAHGAVIEAPLVREPTTIAFHVRGIDGLQLSPATLARIFGHQIVRWNDPAIARDNPQLVLPSTGIVVLQDQGGTAELRLTSYLTTAARGVWKLGASTNAALFQNVQRLQPSDLVKAVAATDGAICYLGPGLADAAGLQTARLAGSHGGFFAPASNDYPLVSARSLYIAATLPDQATADAARAYATWLLTDAQAIFDRLGYGREPESVTRAALGRLGTITVTKPTN
jgi:hypothetical protein